MVAPESENVNVTGEVPKSMVAHESGNVSDSGKVPVTG